MISSRHGKGLVLLLLICFGPGLLAAPSSQSEPSHQTPAAGDISPFEGPVSVSRGRAYVRVGKFVSYYREAAGTLRIDSLLAQKDRIGFIKNRSAYPAFGLTNDTIWLEFSVTRPKDEPQAYLLEVQNAVVRTATLFRVRDGRVTGRWDAGLLIDPIKRPIEHQYQVFALDLAPGETGLFYLRVASEESLGLPMFLWREAEFFRTNTRRNFALGLFFGLLLVMAFYNFFLFLSVRDRAYLYYVVYMIQMGLVFAILYGYAHFFFYQWTRPLIHAFAPMAATAASLAALAFARKFLLLKDNFELGFKAVSVLMILHAVALPLLPLLPKFLPGVFGNGLALLSVCLIVPLAVVRIRQGFRPARYFLFSWSFLISGALLFILQNFGLIGANFVTNNAMMIGTSLEAMLLSLALGYRINDLTRAERETREAALQQEREALGMQLRMSEAFARFVPREFLNFLERDSIVDVVQGDVVRKKMCVMFTDIRGFTELSEAIGSEAVFRFLNAYLERMAPIIEKHGGFIDKFIGDAIMALFQKADAGVLAAIEMARALDDLVQEPGQPGGLRTGFGLHYGELMLGTLGSPTRLETTVIGDTVNLASRIESVTKQYGSRIIVSDSVYRALEAGNTVLAREIDSVFVKGKSRPVVLFEIYQAESESERRARSDHADDFLTALAYFRSGQFAEARRHFESYRSACPNDRIPEIYLRRMDDLQLRSEQSLEGWTGIYETW